MQVKHFLVVAGSLLCFSHYSHSDQTFGQATVSGYDWVMTNILPQQAGLTVSDVIYRYRVEKETSADMLVHVQNENALGAGYIFRSTDDWSGIPSNTINKAVPVANIPLEYWGRGSIEVEGNGEVKDATVVYNYQYDDCFDPQSDPTCPGYIERNLLVVEDPVYEDPLEDEYVKAEAEKKVDLDKKEEEDRQRRRMQAKEKLSKVEKALALSLPALMTAEAEVQAAELLAMGTLPVAYETSVPGGVYQETIKYEDKQLPQNRRALRMGLAEQLLHEEMIKSQYGEGK